MKKLDVIEEMKQEKTNRTKNRTLDSHTRCTYMISEELAERLENTLRHIEILALDDVDYRTVSSGAKSSIVNMAISKVLDAYEEQQSEPIPTIDKVKYKLNNKSRFAYIIKHDSGEVEYIEIDDRNNRLNYYSTDSTDEDFEATELEIEMLFEQKVNISKGIVKNETKKRRILDELDEEK